MLLCGCVLVCVTLWAGENAELIVIDIHSLLFFLTVLFPLICRVYYVISCILCSVRMLLLWVCDTV